MNQLTNDLEVLAGLHERGDLTTDEFVRAKTALLDRTTLVAPASDLSAVQLAKLTRQNEVAQLDREWLIEREKYYLHGKYGGKYIPSKGESIIGGIVAVAFGIFWTASAAGMGAPFFFPLFGLVFIAAAISSAVSGYHKAGQYQQAKARYDAHRAGLTDSSSAVR